MSKPRSIFEEVGTTEKQTVQTGVIDRGRTDARGAMRVWLMVLFVLVVVMITVGGLTRLTDSGLSITEWRPITGAIPPLTAADWQSEFAKYQAIDEWALQNSWMSLTDFKVIYWWEWGHRQLGRVMGLVWLAGLLWFLLRGKIPGSRVGVWVPLLGWGGFAALIAVEIAKLQGAITQSIASPVEAGLMAFMAAICLACVFLRNIDWTGRFFFIGLLGAMQGAIGWWMVSSGITFGEQTLDVASYRLAIHLGLAFVILGFIAWYVFLLGRPERDLMQARRGKEDKQFGLATGLLHFTFLQILLGALVAGIDAGRSFNDWPLMGGEIFPSEAFDLVPVWRNFFENAGLVQFIHRVSGYLLFAFTIVVWLRGRRSSHGATRVAFNAIMAAMSVQIVLGVVTVLRAAPWELAIAHQGLAVVIWVLILRARFLSAYPIASAIRGSA